MDTLLNLVTKVKTMFSCGKKRKRSRGDLNEEDLIFSIKRRRLTEPKFLNFSKSNEKLNTPPDNTFYYDQIKYSRSRQTEIFRRSLDNYDDKDPRNNIIKNLLRKRNNTCKRKLNFDDDNSLDEYCNDNKYNDEKALSNNRLYLELSSDKIQAQDAFYINPVNIRSQVSKSFHDSINESISSSKISVPDQEIEILSKSKHSSEDLILDETPEKTITTSEILSDIESEYNDLMYYIWVKIEKENFPVFEIEQYRKFINFATGKENFDIPKNLNYNKESITKLLPGYWLNDEIINSYIDLILQRQEAYKSIKNNKNNPSVYIFNTYFYEKYKNEKRNNNFSYEKFSKIWEKKNINFYNFKYIIIPIHLQNSHWSLIVLDINDRKITYYDSLPNVLEQEAYSIMNMIAELFTQYIYKSRVEENSNLQRSATKNKRGFRPIPDKNEDEATNKLSTSFTSNVNENNYLADNMQITNNQNQTFNQNNPFYMPVQNISNITCKKIYINSQSDGSESDSDGEIQLMTSFWKFEIATTPKQTNGIDCGVFVCKFMDYISRGQEILFTQEDIRYFRTLMGIQLIEGKMLQSS